MEHCLIPFERVHLPLRPVLSARPSIVPTIAHDLVSSEAIHRRHS